MLTLKRRILLIEAVEKGGRKRKGIAEEFDIPANTLSGIVTDKERYKELFFDSQVDNT